MGSVPVMDALQLTIEKTFAHIERDPQVLLETEGGPVGETADVVVARLYGYDDQLVQEMRLPRAEPVVVTPRFNDDFSLSNDGYATGSMTQDEWHLQSGYGKAWLDASDAPFGTTHDNSFRVRVLCLRYRRRKP